MLSSSGPLAQIAKAPNAIACHVVTRQICASFLQVFPGKRNKVWKGMSKVGNLPVEALRHWEQCDAKAVADRYRSYDLCSLFVISEPRRAIRCRAVFDLRPCCLSLPDFGLDGTWRPPLLAQQPATSCVSRLDCRRVAWVHRLHRIVVGVVTATGIFHRSRRTDSLRNNERVPHAAESAQP